jgi:hypothetical protein
MTRFYEPDLTIDPNSPFVRDASNRLVRRSYWMDMTDNSRHGDDERDRRKSHQRRKESTPN